MLLSKFFNVFKIIDLIGNFFLNTNIKISVEHI